MALASNNREEIQKATDALIEWADENELQVYQNKTELVVFRKGGSLSADEIYCRGQPLRKKNMYKYLGITIQVTGKSFSVHIQEILLAAVRCINDIKNLQLLSLKTAIRVFEVKVLPTLT
jgi:hypothetical protein